MFGPLKQTPRVSVIVLSGTLSYQKRPKAQTQWSSVLDIEVPRSGGAQPLLPPAVGQVCWQPPMDGQLPLVLVSWSLEFDIAISPVCDFCKGLSNAIVRSGAHEALSNDTSLAQIGPRNPDFQFSNPR